MKTSKGSIIISYWKTTGNDGIDGFWFKKFMRERAYHSKWTDDYKKQTHSNGWPKERPHWSKKTPEEKLHQTTYILITCLPMMWKILTAQITEEIHFSLTGRGVFPEDQKEYCKGSRGSVELLYIDQHIFNESKTRRKKSSYRLDWLKKAYDMVPQSSITNFSECTEYLDYVHYVVILFTQLCWMDCQPLGVI